MEYVITRTLTCCFTAAAPPLFLFHSQRGYYTQKGDALNLVNHWDKRESQALTSPSVPGFSLLIKFIGW
jgi:hypothetical protein